MPECTRGSPPPSDSSGGNPHGHAGVLRAVRDAVVVLVALAGLATGCSGPRQADEAVPAVARLVCEDGGARALTPRVRAVSDGIHIEVDNEAGARGFYLRTATSAGNNHGGKLEPTGTTEIRTTMPPGDILVGCFDRAAPYNEVAREYARITVVDPDDLWVDPAVGCETGEQQRYRDGPAEGNAPDDAEAIIRSTVPDVLPTDQVIRPGYPETQWHGESRLVVRNGSPIATVSVYAQYGRWEVNVRACPGSAIG
jgi:hypothetical protein